MTVINPFDFFVEESPSTSRSRTTPASADDLEPVPATRRRAGAAARRRWRRPRRAGRPTRAGASIDFLVGSTSACAATSRTRCAWSPACRRPRRRCERAHRLVPRQRAGCWCRSCAARPRRALRVRLPGPARRRRSRSTDRRPDRDFTDLHAWAEVYVPGAGWIGLDPTSGLLAGEGHIPLACTPAARQRRADHRARPSPAEVDFEFANSCARIHEDPRVTQPYTRGAVGGASTRSAQQVDAELAAGDVRLTMGGEPTFVSIDDMDGREWTHRRRRRGRSARSPCDLTAAPGRRASRRGGCCTTGRASGTRASRCRAGQIAVLWRTDGAPLWTRPGAARRPGEPGREPARRPRGRGRRRDRRRGSASPGARALPAYEDPLDRLWPRRRCPRARRRRLDGATRSTRPTPSAGARARRAPGRRARRRRSAGSLPLRRARATATAGPPPVAAPPRPALLRPRRLAAGPAAAARLAGLDLAAVGTFERSPLRTRRALPLRHRRGAPRPRRRRRRRAERARHATALCVEVRDGHLHVFLPPLERLERLVALLADRRGGRAASGAPVVLEGYAPPRDPALERADGHPGPRRHRGQRAAGRVVGRARRDHHDPVRGRPRGRPRHREVRLDGPHTGTGGGNHLTLGGPTPGRQPAAAPPRPAAQPASPTGSTTRRCRTCSPGGSSARPARRRASTRRATRASTSSRSRSPSSTRSRPRRRRAAVAGRPRCCGTCSTDVTGNTHRAEFCIDKLFSPDSERGRLGLLELRGVRDAAAPADGARAGAAACARWSPGSGREPYRGAARALGHRAARPLPAAAVRRGRHRRRGRRPARARLRRSTRPGWPRSSSSASRASARSTSTACTSSCARRSSRGTCSARRSAGGGTARYVDSSVERLQVTVDGR